MNDLKQKTFLITGTGAVGGYYGGMLVKAGYDVTFIAHGKNYEVLKRNGLTLITPDKTETFSVKVFNSTDDLGWFDYVLICVKSMNTKNTVNKIKNNLGKHSSVVSFQNGVENVEIIKDALGIENTIGANLYLNSWLTEPGIVELLGSYYIKIGALTGKETPQVKELQQIFESAGVTCQISPDIKADMWHKLVWNASVNPVSVLTNKTLDEMLAEKESYSLIKNIMCEVRDVALAHEVNIRRDTIENHLGCVKNYQRGIITSMLQDYQAGKPIELEELVGVVIRRAKEKNMFVPNTEKVYNSLLKLTSVYA
jgi:2-dehydropantoate 2-reductase